ncbi:MAG: hypothetical protein KIT16_06280, partial [Rhodospirillaceae bacterium]|nr:hypothetical protein [Rhodospirillaceae bacterium]
CGLAGRDLAENDITARREISALLRRMPPGLRLPIVVERGGQRVNLTVAVPSVSPPRLVGTAARPPWPG